MILWFVVGLIIFLMSQHVSDRFVETQLFVVAAICFTMMSVNALVESARDDVIKEIRKHEVVVEVQQP